MNTWTLIVILVGAILLIPVAVNPVALPIALLLVAVWVVVTIGGRWAFGEYLDLKKSREMGKDADFGSSGVRDFIGGVENQDDDSGRFDR